MEDVDVATVDGVFKGAFGALGDKTWGNFSGCHGGENIIDISSEKVEGHRDWNSLEYQDTANSRGKKEIKALIFHKIDTEEISDRYVAPCFVNGLEAYDEDDVKPEVVLGRSFMRLTKGIADFGYETITIYHEIDPFLDSLKKKKRLEEAEREALATNICKRYSLLEEERLVIETMAYSDKYKKILDGICLDKLKLAGEMKKEEEEAIIKIKREALIEKEDPKAFVILIRLEGTRHRGGNRCKKRNNNVEPFKSRSYGTSEGCLVPESDCDDKEDYAIQRNKFGAPIYGPRPAQYLNCNDPMDRSLALQEVLNPFRKVCVWKKVVCFLGSLPIPLQHVDWKPDYTLCFNKKEEGDGQWYAEIRLTDPYGNIYDL
nr:hypothetical protein [Tanacetum cinerariifolium]